MARLATRALIAVKDTKNRALFVFADSIVSFTSVIPKASDPGNDAYIMELSNGSRTKLFKEQCDKVIASKLFSIADSETGPAGW